MHNSVGFRTIKVLGMRLKEEPPLNHCAIKIRM